MTSPALTISASAEDGSLDPNHDAIARQAVQGLYEPSALVFWADLTVTALVAWGSLFAALRVTQGSRAMLALLVLSGLAFYRGLCFLHELTHIRSGSLPGFSTVWNFIFGIPFLLPSFTYVGVHSNHHKPATFGTSQDPEYMPFAGRCVQIAIFMLHTFTLPLMLFVRFIVLSPIAFFAPGLQRLLIARASSITMNPAYSRAVNDETVRVVRFWQLWILVLWGALFAGIAHGDVPARILLIWLFMHGTICFVNAGRALSNHRYVTDGKPRDRQGQLLDSVDTPGGWLTEFWAPVGLRYHAVHHYFPGIPYHHLGTAYRRLWDALPPEAAFRQVTTPNVFATFRRLCRGRP